VSAGFLNLQVKPNEFEILTMRNFGDNHAVVRCTACMDREHNDRRSFVN